jgi:hypothetical protein
MLSLMCLTVAGQPMPGKARLFCNPAPESLFVDSVFILMAHDTLTIPLPPGVHSLKLGIIQKTVSIQPVSVLNIDMVKPEKIVRKMPVVAIVLACIGAVAVSCFLISLVSLQN